MRDIRTWDDKPSPGLLLGWHRDHRGQWLGWVIVAQLGISAHGAGPYVRQGWVAAEAIEPRQP
ncbi:hypothetical protein GCM10023340_45310 [Nocardioides marinquilinus]|uniref:GNAT family N-acetyltransferase n=1 Tax=Nocardioides marinquilinus TaxID=1210400 RepID=A0ABP9Q5B9_9ACTN